MILEELKKAGITLVASLPDRWFAGLIRQCETDPEITHVRLAREDDGVGLCAGAFLGGRKAALICQNAGLLVSVNALGGFAYHHEIPMLIIAAHRGGYDDNQYYQMYKGRIVEPVLQALGLPHYVVDGPEDLSRIGEGARHAYLNRMPAVVLLRRRALGGAA
jgi:sulfopyruvate decarboxylase subunit alpha